MTSKPPGNSVGKFFLNHWCKDQNPLALQGFASYSGDASLQHLWHWSGISIGMDPGAQTDTLIGQIVLGVSSLQWPVFTCGLEVTRRVNLPLVTAERLGCSVVPSLCWRTNDAVIGCPSVLLAFGQDKKAGIVVQLGSGGWGAGLPACGYQEPCFLYTLCKPCSEGATQGSRGWQSHLCWRHVSFSQHSV